MSLLDSTASLGRLTTGVKFGISIVVGILFCSLGIYFLTKTDTHTQNTGAKVTSSSCNGNNCNSLVNYTVNKSEYNGSVNDTVSRKIGDEIQIKYDPSNPSDIENSDTNYKTAGTWLIVAGFTVVGISGLIYYFTLNNKAFAAYEGVTGAFDLLNGHF